jgi:hypothetical protein
VHGGDGEPEEGKRDADALHYSARVGDHLQATKEEEQRERGRSRERPASEPRPLRIRTEPSRHHDRRHDGEREDGNAQRVVRQVLPGNATGLDARIASGHGRRAVVPQSAEPDDADPGEPDERGADLRAAPAMDGEVKCGSERGRQHPREDKPGDDDPGVVGRSRRQSADIFPAGAVVALSKRPGYPRRGEDDRSGQAAERERADRQRAQPSSSTSTTRILGSTPTLRMSSVPLGTSAVAR